MRLVRLAIITWITRAIVVSGDTVHTAGSVAAYTSRDQSSGNGDAKLAIDMLSALREIHS